MQNQSEAVPRAENATRGVHADSPTSSEGGKGKNAAKSSTMAVDATIDPTKIPEYIGILEDYMKTCIEEGKFKDAELATQKIEELREQELQFRTVQLTGKHKEEMNELEKSNLQHFSEFNKAWDQAVAELEENLAKIEQELVETHKKELQIFDEEVEKIEIPRVKYSKEILNLRIVFQRMLKAKQFGDAETIKNQIAKMEVEEEAKWVCTFKEKFVKKKQQLVGKQKIEIESLQVKLKNALNEKLKIREVELEKLLQRFQNLKNDLENRQRLELSRLAVLSTKAIQRMTVSRQSVANINASIDNYLGSKYEAFRSKDNIA